MNATITRTAKGYAIQFEGRRPAGIGAAFSFVVVYSTGGWNPANRASDLPCFSKHKSLAAAHKAAAEHVGFSGGTYEVIDLATI